MSIILTNKTSVSNEAKKEAALDENNTSLSTIMQVLLDETIYYGINRVKKND